MRSPSARSGRPSGSTAVATSTSGPAFTSAGSFSPYSSPPWFARKAGLLALPDARHEPLALSGEAFVLVSERLRELSLLGVDTDSEACHREDRSCHEAQHVAGCERDPDDDKRKAAAGRMPDLPVRATSNDLVIGLHLDAVLKK
jgi:hypothetical protein